MPSAHHRFELHALLLCAIWILGFEAAPLGHVALHSVLAPHTHDGGAVDAHEEAHHHDDHDDHDVDHDVAKRSGHGDHSLAHRQIAAKTPLPAIGPVPVANVERLPITRTVARCLYRTGDEPRRARGPPALRA